ncbi:MAG: Rho termination factor N-terminal domain-containing protein [Deltaproteobacteria bacterium]|nr:Rho termination factor N-terminal domain-containing protein [Deltaproteobacteria bacterium]
MGSKKKEAKEKSLEKMTAKELREVAIEISEVTGVHGMNKAELINAIKLAKGIEIESGKKTDSTVREIKGKIKELKAKRETLLESDDNKMAAIYKRRIIRLKKKTRKAA